MRYAPAMLFRVLPLYAGLAPFIAITLAYWLGVRHGVLPSCIPYLDGCTSISATGRYMPGSLLFRAVMLPQAIVLALLWYFAALWIDALSPARRSARMVLIWGLLGALALILYVTFLGTKAPFYELMRRFGIYLYFLGTIVAQVSLALALRRHVLRHDAPALERSAQAMLWLCGLPFALGLLNLVLKATLAEPDFVENRIEWIVSLMMQAYFVVLWAAWRKSGYSISVRVMHK